MEIHIRSRSPWEQSHWIELWNTFPTVYNSVHITYKLTELCRLQNSTLCKKQQKSNKKTRNNRYLGAFEARNDVVD